MRHLIVLMAAISLAGCGLSQMIQKAKQDAEIQLRFKRAVDARRVVADDLAVAGAVETAMVDDELLLDRRVSRGETTLHYARPNIPGWVSNLHAGLKAAGSTDTYDTTPGSCRIDANRTEAGVAFQVKCFTVEVERDQRDRRIERTKLVDDPWFALRILEHLDPSAAELWNLEATGHRTRRCAEQSYGPAFLAGLGCPDPTPRPKPPAPPSP